MTILAGAGQSLEQAWLAAEREQETGGAGNYTQNTPGCLGAYCWSQQSNWASDAQKAGYGQYANTPPDQVPPAVQDAVAWAVMGPYVTKGQYAQAAEVWNGGVPYSVPNPVLGSSANYASQVISKFKAIMGGNIPQGSSSSGGLSANASSPSAPGPASSGSCTYQISLPDPFPNICLDSIVGSLKYAVLLLLAMIAAGFMMIKGFGMATGAHAGDQTRIVPVPA